MLNKESRFNNQDLLLFSLFSALILLWFQNVVFYNNIFSYADLGRYFYPLREFAAASIKAGGIPLWNPYLECGTPFLATLQSCVFYPLSVIYYISPSFEWAFNWYIVTHFILAGVFMYLLMRHWNASRAASGISSLVFVFGGYLNSVICMNTSLSSVIWLPLIFLFFDIALKKESIAFSLLTGIVLAIQFLGGEPTVIYCTIWMLFFYFLGYLFLKYKDERAPKKIIRPCALFLIAVLSWIFISMIQLLPFLELLSNSSRTGPSSFGVASHWSLLPGELFGFLIPYIFGNTRMPGSYLVNTQDWLPSFYIGIMPFILVIFSVLTRPKKRVFFFFGIVLLSLALALGRYTPLYEFLYKNLFGFAHIRYPVKFIFLSSFALSVLSGMGFDSLIKIVDKKRKEIITRTLLILNVSLGLLLLFFLKYWRNIYGYIAGAPFPTEHSGNAALAGFPVVFLNDSANLRRLFILFSMAALLIILFLKKKIRLAIFNLLAISMIFLDLVGINMTGLAKATDISLLTREPASFAAVKEDKAFSDNSLWQRVLE